MGKRVRLICDMGLLGLSGARVHMDEEFVVEPLVAYPGAEPSSEFVVVSEGRLKGFVIAVVDMKEA